MGGEAHFDVELEGGLKLLDGIEQEPETKKIEEAVGVLLKGLGEDVNREGIRKTPFRVAKALREATIGTYEICSILCSEVMNVLCFPGIYAI